MSSHSIDRLTYAGLLLMIFFSTGMISACDSSVQTPAGATPTLTSVYQLDPTFREFYKNYGGAKVYSEPISQMVEQNGNKYQFTATALLVYDSQAPDSKKYRLAPLGTSIISPDRMDPPQPPPAEPDPFYIDGRYVYEPFRDLYKSLGGAEFVGRPLTGVRYDALTDRYEQYFENLGFFVAAEPGAEVGMLNYGAWMCTSKCRSPQKLNGSIQHIPEIKPPFEAVVAQLGRELTGEPLAMAAYGSDGRLEQVFANLVLIADAISPENSNLVTIRPLSELLNILPSPLVTPVNQADMVFFDVNGGQGYNIPVSFKAFIDQHGGFGIFGEPITELARLNERISRQCFRNMCLDMDPSAPPHLQIRPAPLGVDYLKANLQSHTRPTAAMQSFQQITIQVWETQEQVASNQEQEIWASLSQNGQPLVNIQPLLVLNLPDGSQARYDMPATGGDGRTSLTIPPITAANGVLIPYELCVPQGEQMFCARQEYLILNLP